MTLEDRVKQFIESNQPCTLREIINSIGESGEAIRKAIKQLDGIDNRNRRFMAEGVSNSQLYIIIAKRLNRPVYVAELSRLTGVSEATVQNSARKVLFMVGSTKRNGKRISLYSHKEPEPQKPEPVKSIIHLLKMRTDQSIGIQYHTRFQFI